MLPGFEFLIAFENFDLVELQMYLRKFPDRPEGRDAEPHFELQLEKEGIYFHDIARSDFSARTFRALIELALEFSEISVNGFGCASIPELTADGLHAQLSPDQAISTRVE